jgi:hypothetical protein
MEIVDSVFELFDKLPIPGWVWPAAFFAFILAMLIFHLTLGVRRNSMWERASMMLGFQHRSDASLAANFKFLNSFLDVDGFNTRSLDVLTGELSGTPTWLFDHSSGSPRQFRTACLMRNNQLRVPHFHLYQMGKLPIS